MSDNNRLPRAGSTPCGRFAKSIWTGMIRKKGVALTGNASNSPDSSRTGEPIEVEDLIADDLESWIEDRPRIASNWTKRCVAQIIRQIRMVPQQGVSARIPSKA